MKISNSFLRFLFYMGFNILFLFELFLANKIIGLNDSLYLNKKGIDSEIVSICPSVGGEIDYTHFENCHKLKDNIDTIKISDMERFVLNFLLPITLNN